MSEVSEAELEAIYARIDAACDRATARCSGDEIEAMGSLSTEVHDLIALRARLVAQDTELAVLRAQLAPLCAVHDALVAAAALPGAGASGEEMVAAVREKGAAEGYAMAHRFFADVVETLATTEGTMAVLGALVAHRRASRDGTEVSR